MVEEQFNLLYESIQTISNAKNLEDKFQHEMSSLKDRLETLTNDNAKTMD